MTEYIKYYLKPAMIAFLAFLVLFFAFRYAITAKGFEITGWKILEDKAGIFSGSSGILNATFYKVLKSPSTVTITADINLQSSEGKAKYLYIPQIDASYFAVKTDGKVIGSFGFRDDKTGHTWYQPYIFLLPDSFDTLEIEIAGVYEIGIDFTAKVIDNSQKGKYQLLYLLTAVLLPISLGLAVTISIILYLIARTMDKSKQTIYLHLSISSFLGGIWMFDMIPFPTFGSTLGLLIFRKIFVVSAYLAFASLIYGINKEYFEDLKILDKIMISANITAAILVLLSPTNYSMKILTNNIAILLVVNAIYLFWKALGIFSQILFAFAFFFILTVAHDGMSMLFSTNAKLLSAFGIVSLFAGFAYSLVSEYKEMIVRVTMSHLRSVTDPLTGAYNRGFLSEVSFSSEDSFVYIDMDNFKSINDNYGHKVGDEILKLLVQTIRKNIRSNDYVIRMGGDEFLTVLRNCPVEKAKEIFDKIAEEFSNTHELRPGFSFGVVQYILNTENTLRIVDTLMYKMKETKRQKNNLV
ncbi:GGDEF domain-containing protein [Fervidobacterium islandicum]|uniref:GGDEF domain-containing protein n=1 Tax=Fervidobacterium islandicum TaxID=2423 RepID=UPI003A6FBF01